LIMSAILVSKVLRYGTYDDDHTVLPATNMFNLRTG